MRFAGVEELKEQIRQDIDRSRQILTGAPKIP
jgi:FAD synthase